MGRPFTTCRSTRHFPARLTSTLSFPIGVTHTAAESSASASTERRSAIAGTDRVAPVATGAEVEEQLRDALPVRPYEVREREGEVQRGREGTADLVEPVRQ